MAQNTSGIYIKKGQSVDSGVIEQAQQNPERMITYLESLPDEMQQYANEDGNLISHLYQVALKSLSMTTVQSA
jgi:hypothetical protein